MLLNVSIDEADLDVLPQEPIDEDDIIGLRWEDIAHASTGIYCLYAIFWGRLFPLYFILPHFSFCFFYSLNPCCCLAHKTSSILNVAYSGQIWPAYIL